MTIIKGLIFSQPISGKFKGLNLSLLAQATQVISFVLFGYIFDFAIGIYFRITTELTNDTIVGLDFGFANWNLSRSANPDIIELNINAVAIILLFLIAKSANQIKAELNK